MRDSEKQQSGREGNVNLVTTCSTCMAYLNHDCDPLEDSCQQLREELRDYAERFPCIGCGYCCKKALCWEGQQAHPEQATTPPCPELKWDEGEQRYWCGLIAQADPKRAAELKASLFTEAGCCMTLNTSRADMLKDKGLPNNAIFDFSSPRS